MGKSYLQGEVLTAADLNASLAEAVNTTGTFTFTGAHIHSANLWANGSDGGFRVLSTAAVQSFRTDESTSFYTLINGMDDTGIYYASTATFASNKNFRWRITDNSGNLRDYLILDRRGNLSVANNITSGAAISDQIGNVRKVITNTVTSPYTLVATDAGKMVMIAGGTLTIPASVFTNGENVTIFNTSETASLSIVQGTNLRILWAGQSSATTGNRTLGLAGLCTIAFTTSDGRNAVITGAGLT